MLSLFPSVTNEQSFQDHHLSKNYCVNLEDISLLKDLNNEYVFPIVTHESFE